MLKICEGGGFWASLDGGRREGDSELLRSICRCTTEITCCAARSARTRQPQVAVVDRGELLEVLLDVRPAVVLISHSVAPLPPEIVRESHSPDGAHGRAEEQPRVPAAEVGEDPNVPPRAERPDAVHPALGVCFEFHFNEGILCEALSLTRERNYQMVHTMSSRQSTATRRRRRRNRRRERPARQTQLSTARRPSRRQMQLRQRVMADRTTALSDLLGAVGVARSCAHVTWRFPLRQTLRGPRAARRRSSFRRGVATAIASAVSLTDVG